MKTILNYSFAALLTFFVLNACVKKSDRIPGDTITLRTLGQEPSASTTGSTTTGSTTTGSTTTGSTTTGGITQGQLTLWTSPYYISYGGGGIRIYIDNVYQGDLTTGLSSTPFCGALYTITKTLSVGSHTWYGTSFDGLDNYGTSSSPNIVQINSSCRTEQLVL